MGRHLPWRKTLIVLLTTISPLYSSPEASKHNKVNWKLSQSIKENLEINKNNYKEFKTFSIEIEDKTPIEKQYKKAQKSAWEKYLQSTYNRLLPYRDYMAQVAQEEEVPYELLYLPIVESGARPWAVSRVGAVGLWQFMPSSGREYQMYRTEWLDERRDFIKATNGAIKKLKYNYNVTGDWLLALAAYNCGLGRVQRTVKKTGISDFWELSKKGLLPRETINYVPKFLLVSSLMQNKMEFGVDVKWEIKSWSQIPLESAVDLKMLSDRTGIPLDTLEIGNSELNYRVTPPVSANYKLKVPTQYTDSVIEALNSETDPLLEFYRHRVVSGDTLSEIGQHYGLSTYGLLKYNPGVSARNLRIGKTLIIPALKKVEPYSKKKSLKAFKNSYIVKEGDTLWDISLKFNTTVEEIALNSGLNPNGYIKEGMELKVP